MYTGYICYTNYMLSYLHCTLFVINCNIITLTLTLQGTTQVYLCTTKETSNVHVYNGVKSTKINMFSYQRTLTPIQQ